MSDTFWSLDVEYGTWTKVCLNEPRRGPFVTTSETNHHRNTFFKKSEGRVGTSRQNRSRVASVPEASRLGITCPVSQISAPPRPTKKMILSAQRSAAQFQKDCIQVGSFVPSSRKVALPSFVSPNYTFSTKTPSIPLTRKQKQKEDHKFRTLQVEDEKNQQKLHPQISRSTIEEPELAKESRYSNCGFVVEEKSDFLHEAISNLSMTLGSERINVSIVTVKKRERHPRSTPKTWKSEFISDDDASETSDITFDDSIDENEYFKPCLPVSIETSHNFNWGNSSKATAIVASNFIHPHEDSPSEHETQEIAFKRDHDYNDSLPPKDSVCAPFGEKYCMPRRLQVVPESQVTYYSDPLQIQRLREKRDAKMNSFVASMSRAKSYDLANTAQRSTTKDVVSSTSSPLKSSVDTGTTFCCTDPCDALTSSDVSSEMDSMLKTLTEDENVSADLEKIYGGGDNLMTNSVELLLGPHLTTSKVSFKRICNTKNETIASSCTNSAERSLYIELDRIRSTYQSENNPATGSMVTTSEGKVMFGKAVRKSKQRSSRGQDQIQVVDDDTLRGRTGFQWLVHTTSWKRN